MSETALGHYGTLMKRTIVASVLDFTDEEWANLQKLREEKMHSTKAGSTTDEMNESWMDTIEERQLRMIWVFWGDLGQSAVTTVMEG